MSGAALRDSGAEYPKADQRKPPICVPRTKDTITLPAVPQVQERLLDAREVAARLGVSERWVRDHTTRRSPKIRAIKLGPLLRFRWADVEAFLADLDTARPSHGQRFGV